MPDSTGRRPRVSMSRTGPHDTRTPEEVAATVLKLDPIELEERVEFLNKPLIIENAFSGWQPRQWAPAWAFKEANREPPEHYEEGGIRFPAVPTTIEDQVEGLVEGIEAGCAVTHVHPRDPSDGVAVWNPELYAEIYDQVLERHDAVSCNHTWSLREDGSIDYVTHTTKLLELGKGNRYCQAAVVLWPPWDSYPPGYEDSLLEGMEVFLENKVTPVHKIRSAYHLRKFRRVLVDTEVLPGPHVLVHDMGHPFGWPMDTEPWWPIDLVTSTETTKKQIPDSVIGVFSGGRNWMPITMFAILTGVDYVRVGIEDCYWMYPHRDDVIQRNIDAVRKITSFCELIGRPIATPEEARGILGVERTS